MEQNGRKAFETEITDLKEKLETAERALKAYDMLYEKFYEAMPKLDKVVTYARRQAAEKTVQRAMSDAYTQWQEDISK